jgi:hypothetical protein
MSLKQVMSTLSMQMVIWKLKTVQRPYKSGGEWISSVAESALMAILKLKKLQ